jgi:hypothetical protein
VPDAKVAKADQVFLRPHCVDEFEPLKGCHGSLWKALHSDPYA